MNLKLKLKQALLTTIVAVSSILPLHIANASVFEETEVNQNKFVAIAQPFGQESTKYDLIVLEQIPGKQPCWSEAGSNPVIVEPLLMQFDFSGHCRRATDSNGYSIRVEGQDMGLEYLLTFEKKDGELLLVGMNSMDPGNKIIIGRTRGFSNGMMKVFLDSGWQFSKRNYQGETLGHVYFSYSGQLANQGN